MRRGWLAPLTRADGRALSRALAALLLICAFVSGLHGGLAASPGPTAGILCQADADKSAPAPVSGHEHDCCLPATATPAAPPTDAAGSPPVPLPAFALAPESQVPPFHRALTRAGPRAPPSLPA